MMKGIVLSSPGDLQTADFRHPGEPGPDEVLADVHRIGVCGTDLHAFEGSQTFFTYPRVLGHELGVRIAAVGSSVQDLAVGDLCAVEPYLNCGQCIACRNDKPNCCRELKVLGVHTDGGMLGTLRVPARKLHRSDKLSADHLALVETLAVGAHAVRRACLEPEEAILVIGTGPIGLAVLESARAEGARMAVLEQRKDRIRFCEKVVPGCHFVESDDPQTGLLEVFEGDLPTAVFDCTGSPGSMMASFDYAAHGGRIVFVGHFPGDVTFHDPVFHGKELTLLASRNSTSGDFRAVLERMEQGRLNVSQWITHRVSRNRFIETFPQWLSPEAGVFKGMVEWDP